MIQQSSITPIYARDCLKNICMCAGPAEVFGKAPFMRAFSVVMGHAVYLPSAECFALMPIASLLERTGNESAGCTLDYDADSKSAVLTTPRPLRWVLRGIRDLHIRAMQSRRPLMPQFRACNNKAELEQRTEAPLGNGDA
eukprot:1159682-Pelagomonas_calceolata.AAC.4